MLTFATMVRSLWVILGEEVLSRRRCISNSKPALDEIDSDGPLVDVVGETQALVGSVQIRDIGAFLGNEESDLRGILGGESLLGSDRRLSLDLTRK
jgi:hypothetical protein